MAVTKKRELKVLFDTNVLFTQVASDLLRKDVAELLANPVDDPNLQITWILPRMVRDEREYQMRLKAKELLPSLAKLEKVIGHQLGITPEIVSERVNTTIERQLKQYGIRVADLDLVQVNWAEILKASVDRLPPFDTGEKEKGFRDAVVVETFVQELKRSPKTASICLIAAVSEDGLVREALKKRIGDASNVRVLSNLDELETLINTLASEVSEEYVAELTEKATPMFWTEPSNKNALYFQWNVEEQIKSSFKADLAAKPPGIEQISKQVFWITKKPQFVRKSGTLVHWQSRVRVEQELLPPSPAAVQQAVGLLSLPTAASPAASVAEPLKRDLVFWVRWSTRVNAKKQLSSAKLEEIVKADGDAGKTTAVA